MKRKKQPTAEVMRQQLALAADEIIRLKTELARWEPVGMVALSQQIQRDANERMAHSLDALRWPRTPRAPWWRRLLGAFR